MEGEKKWRQLIRPMMHIQQARHYVLGMIAKGTTPPTKKGVSSKVPTRELVDHLAGIKKKENVTIHPLGKPIMSIPKCIDIEEKSDGSYMAESSHTPVDFASDLFQILRADKHFSKLMDAFEKIPGLEAKLNLIN